MMKIEVPLTELINETQISLKKEIDAKSYN